jgi:hypothetical protein
MARGQPPRARPQHAAAPLPTELRAAAHNQPSNTGKLYRCHARGFANLAQQFTRARVWLCYLQTRYCKLLMCTCRYGFWSTGCCGTGCRNRAPCTDCISAVILDKSVFGTFCIVWSISHGTRNRPGWGRRGATNLLQSATSAHTSPAINGIYIRQTNARITHNTAW